MTVRQDAGEAVVQKPLKVAAEGFYLAADDRKAIPFPKDKCTDLRLSPFPVSNTLSIVYVPFFFILIFISRLIFPRHFAILKGF